MSSRLQATMRWRPAVSILLLVGSLSACSWAPSLGVYKIEINQGNYVTRDAVERLKTGMTRQQVRTALGTPLVTSAFHSNRWDYVYELQRRGQRIEHRRFSVFFTDDKLASWEGDPMPESPLGAARAAADAASPAGETPKAASPAPEKGFFDRLWERFGW